MSMENENRPDQNLLCCLEEISAGAAECRLDIKKFEQANPIIKELAGFLGISIGQALFFACITELSFHRSAGFDTLSKHLKCSVIKVVGHMEDLEVLRKRGYIQKSVRGKGRTYSISEIGFSVPHNVIEALRTGDKSLLDNAVRFDLPSFLRQVSDIIDERTNRNLSTREVFRELEFLISNNRELSYVSFIDDSLSDIAGKCTAFAISYTRLKGQMNVSIDRFAAALFDDIGEQLQFSLRDISS